MATILGSLLVSLGLESAQFRKGMTDAERQMKVTQQKFDKIGSKMADVGGKMSLAITAPLAAFAGLSFKTASDAAELQSAFDQTFGNMSKAMTQWAETTGDAMGRSTQELQRAANTFGIFFNQAAPTKAAAAEMSQSFSILAQDLASFYNVDPGTALDKLRSGLSGESEPLRDFGVFLNEAAVKAKALEMGLGGVSGVLTEQEKIMARAAVIMEQTANAQGDVARTSDGTANQMRAAAAAFEELQVTIGTKLLPILTPLISKLADALNWFSKLPDPVKNTALVVAGLGAALGPIVFVVGNLTSAFGILLPVLTKLGPVINIVRAAMMLLAANPAILAFAAVVAGIYLAWKNWDKISAIVKRVYTAVKTWMLDKLGAVFNGVKQKIEMVEGAFAWMWDRVVGNSWVPDMVDAIGVHMGRLDKLMADPATKATQSVSDAMREMARETSVILDRLFPEVRKAMEYQRELATLRQAGLTPEQLKESERRLGRETVTGYEGGRVGIAAAGTGPLTGELAKETERMMDIMDRAAGRTKVQTVRIAESFKDMADKTVSAVQNMASAIKGGGFLDILGAAIGMFTQLGSSGLFGNKIATNLNGVAGARAMGGPVSMGKTYLVGERGPELFTAGRTGQIVSNDNLRGMGSQVQIVPSPYFDVVVDGRVQRAAPGIAGAGAQLAGAQMTQQRSRRLA